LLDGCGGVGTIGLEEDSVLLHGFDGLFFVECFGGEPTEFPGVGPEGVVDEYWG
jgi:hypothetical protein